ncbi:MAG: L-histidine N(alpha)-methyltransferase [Pseudanabaenaceae cyanobacterium bins.68]|nr:L-histidine N(alpha)-methyltransferase [Pseudanabaenaceae cyanobacterium bins.68]
MISDRLRLKYLAGDLESNLEQAKPQTSDLGLDVLTGLSASPKTLPARYFYDQRGSQLFEQICTLPEYYPTRTEAEILRSCAREIAEITQATELVELGSGSSVKTRILLDALSDRPQPFYYLPSDISGTILAESALALVQDYPNLKLDGWVGSYEQVLAQLGRTLSDRRLICFLGSTLGNFADHELDLFLTQVAGALHPGEFFLIGIDLQKSAQMLEPAYNDAQGVTAAFNLNMLLHLNQRFAGDFQPDQFSHLAFYNLAAAQIEMHLRSLVDQTVTLKLNGQAYSFNFIEGETIQTEISRKFDLDHLGQLLAEKHLPIRQIWTDPHNWFAVVLTQASRTVV